MQDINHGKYINYLISQSNSEIDAATSTAQKRGGRARDRECRSRRSALPAGNAVMVGKGREKAGEK